MSGRHIVPKGSIVFLIVSIFMALGYGATIAQQEVTMDVENPSTPVQMIVDLHYRQITSDQISYLIPYAVQNIRVSDKHGVVSCSERKLSIGTEVLCEPRQKANYSVTLRYATNGVVTPTTTGRYMARYQHTITNPTQRFTVRVLLPEGYGVAEENASTRVMPSSADIGSTGRRIFVEWDTQDVPLGDRLSYSAQFEDLTLLQQIPYTYIIPFVVIILALVVSLVVLRFRQRRSRIDEAYHALKQEEQQIIDYLRSRDGECKQRDIVKALDLSKAKASRLVADLEERALVEKIKRGRSNKIRLRD